VNDYLLLRLEAPLMSFGGVVIDNHGVEMPFPPPSMITGLLANALGYRRQDFDKHQRLQERLSLVVRCDRPGESLRDFQTAELDKSDHGWTTRGEIESRDGGAGTYVGKHIRYRDYHADRSVLLAIWLEPFNEKPSLADLQQALKTPKRPLFLGRKSCLPSTYIDAGSVQAGSPIAALAEVPALEPENARVFEPVPLRDSPEPDDLRIGGLRNWANQVHGGEQRWRSRPWLLAQAS